MSNNEKLDAIDKRTDEAVAASQQALFATFDRLTQLLLEKRNKTKKLAAVGAAAPIEEE